MVLKEGEIVVEVLVKGFDFTNAKRVYKSVADPKQAEEVLRVKEREGGRAGGRDGRERERGRERLGVSE